MNTRRVVRSGRSITAQSTQIEPSVSRDYDVLLTLANGGTTEHKSRASSPTLALRLAIDSATRANLSVVKAEVME